MTASHETPVASDTAPSHSTSSSTVAPRVPSTCVSPKPTSWPSTPPAPALSCSVGAEKCSVARPQLVATVSSPPTTLYHAELLGTAGSRPRNSSTPASSTSAGNRYAETPNSQNATS